MNYAHPSLIPILERTYGVPIFQEQVMQIANRVASFSMAEAVRIDFGNLGPFGVRP